MKEMSFRLENAGKGQGRNLWQTLEKSKQVNKSATTCGLALLKPPSSGGEQAGNPLFPVHSKGTPLSGCLQVSVLWFANIEFSKTVDKSEILGYNEDNRDSTIFAEGWFARTERKA